MLSLLSPQVAWAQAAAACDANEDIIRLNFGTTPVQNANGTTATWIAGAVTSTFLVGTTTSVNRNTVTISMQTLPAAGGGTGTSFITNFPALNTQGGIITLDTNIDTSLPGDGAVVSVKFSRPVDKLRAFTYDIDANAAGWQDILEITGRLNGNTVTFPTGVPNVSGSFTIVNDPVTGATRLTSAPTNSCASTDPNCNVRLDFTNPIDELILTFKAGANVALPTSQRFGFNTAGYCVPKRELALVKVDGPASTALVNPILVGNDTFVAGTSDTYALTVANLGNVNTNAIVFVRDQILTPGVSFSAAQTPGSLFTCVISTTTFASDTIECQRPAGSPILGNSVQTLSLNVDVAPGFSATQTFNIAKTWGGGDPNKPAVNSTGAFGACTEASERYTGGGATYFGGSPTLAGCAYEATPVIRNANLSVTKSNGINSPTALVTGNTTTYTLTYSNLGPSSANNSIVKDIPSAGLQNCQVTNCTSAGTPTAATCPALAVRPNIFTAAGVAIPTLPPNSSVTFQVACAVTATGL